MTIATDRSSAEDISVKTQLRTLEWSDSVLFRRVFFGIKKRSASVDSDWNFLTDFNVGGTSTKPNAYDSEDGAQDTTSTVDVPPLMAIANAYQEVIEIGRYLQMAGDVPSHLRWLDGQFLSGGTYGGTSPGIATTSDLKSKYYHIVLNILWQIFTTNRVRDITDLKHTGGALVAGQNTFGAGAAMALSDFDGAFSGTGNVDFRKYLRRMAYLAGLIVKGMLNPKDGIILKVYIDPTKNVTIDNLRVRTFYKLAHRIYLGILASYVTDLVNDVAGKLNATALGSSEYKELAIVLGYAGSESIGSNNVLRFLFRNNDYDQNSAANIIGIPQFLNDTTLSTVVTNAIVQLWTGIKFRTYTLFSDLSRLTFGLSLNKGGMIHTIDMSCDGLNSQNTNSNRGPDDVANKLLLVLTLVRRFTNKADDYITAVENLNAAKNVATYQDPVLKGFELTETAPKSFQGFIKYADLKFLVQKDDLPLTGTTKRAGYLSAADNVFYSNLSQHDWSDTAHLNEMMAFLAAWKANPDYTLRIIGDDQIQPIHIALTIFFNLKYSGATVGDEAGFTVLLGAVTPGYLSSGAAPIMLGLQYLTGAAYNLEVGLDNLDLDSNYLLPDITLEARNATYPAVVYVDYNGIDQAILNRGFEDPIRNRKDKNFKPWVFDVNPAQTHRMLSKWLADTFKNSSPSLKEIELE